MYLGTMDIPRVPTTVFHEPRCTIKLDHMACSDEMSSSCGDSICGEPLSPQHIVVDFTPTEEDTEFVQKKCCAFWDFIRSIPEMQRLKVLPEEQSKEPDEIDLSSESLSTSTFSEDPVKLESGEKTAVSVMEMAKQGVLEGAFDAKLCQTLCSLGPREYTDGEANITDTDDKMKRVCPCTTVCKCNARTNVDILTKRLCETMKDWDRTHPKSMEPPGHPPSLQQGCIMQRAD